MKTLLKKNSNGVIYKALFLAETEDDVRTFEFMHNNYIVFGETGLFINNSGKLINKSELNLEEEEKEVEKVIKQFPQVKVIMLITSTEGFTKEEKKKI